MNQTVPKNEPLKSPPVEQPLPLTLEELFHGTTKKLKVTRKVLGPDGVSTSLQEKVLNVHVKRGWRAGTKITFPREGDQGPNVVPGERFASILGTIGLTGTQRTLFSQFMRSHIRPSNVRGTICTIPQQLRWKRP